MPTKLIATFSLLGLQALSAWALAALAATRPDGVTMAVTLGFIGLVQVLFIWGLSRGKDGVRGLVAVLSAMSAAGQLVCVAAVLSHFNSKYGQASDLTLGIQLGIGCALNLVVTWSLTRRDVKQWMAEKSMPGAEIDAIEG